MGAAIFNAVIMTTGVITWQDKYLFDIMVWIYQQNNYSQDKAIPIV